MTGNTIASSPLLYILIGLGLAAIVLYALVCLKKAKKCCIEQGISEEKIKQVISSTISASIVPSLAILIGFLILAASLMVSWCVPSWPLSLTTTANLIPTWLTWPARSVLTSIWSNASWSATGKPT